MKKKIRTDLPELTWPDILREINNISPKRPDIELALAAVFEQDYLNQLNNKSLFLSLIKKLVMAIIGKRQKPIEVLDLPPKAGLFALNLPRGNDFGIIFPIIKEIDNIGFPTIIIILSNCYEKKKGELQYLKHTKIILKENIKPFTPKPLDMVKEFIISFKSYKFLLKNILSGKVLNYIEDHKIDFIKIFLSYRRSINSYESFLARVNIQYVFSLGSKIWGLFGLRNNVTTYVIQHGHDTEAAISYWNAYTPANNSEVLVFGDIYKKIVNNVYPQNKVSSLGSPFYDDKFSYSKQLSSRLRITFFFTIHVFIGEKATRDGVDFVNLYLDFVIQLYEMNKENIDIKIKLHPNSQPDYIYEYNNIFGKEIEIISNKDSFEVFKETDISVSWSSTIAMESVLAGVLYIQLLLDEKWKFHEYYYAIQKKNYNDFVSFIDEIRSNPKKYPDIVRMQKEKLSDYLSNVGNSAKSIADHLINNL